MDIALNIAEIETIRSENLRLQSTQEAIRSEFWMKGALVTVEIASFVVGDSQISLI